MSLTYDEFVEKAESLTDQLQVLIEQMPSKGDIEADCQRLCLLNRLSDLQKYINGTERQDFVEDEGEVVDNE